MLLSNQIAGFLNQPYLQNKLMEQLDFLHVHINSNKMLVKNVSSGLGQ